MTAPSRFIRLTIACAACLVTASPGFAETLSLPAAVGGVAGPTAPDPCCATGNPATPGAGPQSNNGPALAGTVDSAAPKPLETALAPGPDSWTLASAAAAAVGDPAPAAAASLDPAPAAAPQSGWLSVLSSLVQSGVGVAR